MSEGGNKVERKLSPTPRALIPMATIKHIVIHTAGLVVVSQKLITAAAADNSAKTHSVSKDVSRSNIRTR